MPLPNDEKVIALSNEMIAAFDALFGVHPGFRPVHAKGTLLTGTFTPSAWNARPFLYQLGTIKLVLRGSFDGTRQEAYGRADCEPAAAG
jgi:hypothetical protein